MYQTLTYPGIFYNDTELSASALKILRNNAAALHGMVRRNHVAQFSNRTIDFATALNPSRIWWGTFEYRIGLTTATLKIFCTPSGQNENLRVTINGATVYNALMTSGINTVTVTIGAGLTHGQVCYVVVDAVFSGPPNGAWATYMMTEAYTSPASAMISTIYTAPTTFTTLSQTNVNNLVSAQRYVIDRLRTVPMPLQMSLRHVGLWWEPHVTPLAIYRFARTGDKTQLRVTIDWASRGNQNTTFQILINGGLVDSFSFGDFETGTHRTDIDITGCTLDVSNRLTFQENIITGPPTWRGAVNTKYSTRLIETINTAYTGVTLPTETAMLESMTFTTLQGRLNSLGTITAGIKTSLDANPVMFDRIPMFSRRGVIVDDHDSYFQKWHVARKKREGDVLVVRGKNLKIMWGYVTVQDVDKPEYSFSNEENLTSGDAIETKVFYLDQFDGLYYGFPYFVGGTELHYACEYYFY